MASLSGLPTDGLSQVTLPPPPPGFAYTFIVQPALGILLTFIVGTAMLFPLLVTLFFFSTQQLRRKPIFIMNVLSMSLGIATGVTCAVHLYWTIAEPTRPSSINLASALGSLITITPIIVETILVLRLLAVYPYDHTPRWLFTLIFVPLALIKTARIVNVGIFIHRFDKIMKSSANSLIGSEIAWSAVSKNAKTEWLLQVVDNTAASGLFLYKIDIRKTLMSSRYSATNNRRGSYTSIITGLFWIAISNFTFPVILSIIELIMLFHESSFISGAYVLIVNDYVQIIGVLLATVWVAGAHWLDDKTPTKTNMLPSMKFASRAGGGGGGAPVRDTMHMVSTNVISFHVGAESEDTSDLSLTVGNGSESETGSGKQRRTPGRSESFV
ncbi:hypothetical protein AMATHDRAFT_6724 [Amanita thiersii Skay4041]|uniref:G-protein coupled receptors family 1 profile domain-containing protein n=1 Tax=Amanita thiersii Skay4041 TaxID=703135 RepID=A0A2A9NBN5_9AGAR|nr:hypothetical protein AMATHDRAFT_6724 [Amanita thiersii Skay4041]